MCRQLTHTQRQTQLSVDTVLWKHFQVTKGDNIFSFTSWKQYFVMYVYPKRWPPTAQTFLPSISASSHTLPLAVWKATNESLGWERLEMKPRLSTVALVSVKNWKGKSEVWGNGRNTVDLLRNSSTIVGGDNPSWYDWVTTVEPLYNGHPWDQKFCPL